MRQVDPHQNNRMTTPHADPAFFLFLAFIMMIFLALAYHFFKEYQQDAERSDQVQAMLAHAQEQDAATIKQCLDQGGVVIATTAPSYRATHYADLEKDPSVRYTDQSYARDANNAVQCFDESILLKTQE